MHAVKRHMLRFPVIKGIFMIFGSLLLIASPGSVSAEYYLGVVRGEAKKIPLVVLDIHDDADAPDLREMALTILRADLRRSQIFEVKDPKEIDLDYRSETEPPDEVLRRAGTFGITGAVWARLHRKGRELVLSGRVYDATSGLRLAGKEYFGNRDTLRRMVHEFADEIVSRYTGEKGIARTRIAYISDKTGHKEVYLMDYDGAHPRKVSADHSICMSPAWSPNGKTLAYVSFRDNNPDLYALNLDSGKRWKLLGMRGLNISPAWSPDGKRLAVALSRHGGAEIYTISMTGKLQERLTYGTYDNVSPSWSANGREIVFTSGRPGTPQLYIMNVDGADVRRVTFEGIYNSSPHWSPRGDRIVFCSMVKGRFKIATIRPDGSDLRLLTDGGGNDEDPTWSPSGRQIVFSSNREGKFNIYIMNADGTDIERITPNDANYTSPAWSP